MVIAAPPAKLRSQAGRNLRVDWIELQYFISQEAIAATVRVVKSVGIAGAEGRDQCANLVRLLDGKHSMIHQPLYLIQGIKSG